MNAQAHDDPVHAHDPGSLKDWQLLRRVLALAWARRGAFAAIVALLVLGLGLKLAGPWVIRIVLDGPVARALEGGDADLPALAREVTGYALWYALIAAITAGTLVVREWLMNRTGQQIVYGLRNRLFDHVLRLPVGWFDRHPVGWIVTRSTSDVDALAEMYTTGVATIAYDILSIAVFLGALILLSPKLAVVGLLVLPLMLCVSFRFRLAARRAFRATRVSLSRLNAFLQERLVGLAVVRLFARERASAERFDELNTQFYSDNMVTVKHFARFFPTVDTCAMLVKMGTLAWGAALLASDQLTIGVFVQFWLVLELVFEPIRELAERYNILQAAMAAAERVFGVLDTPGEGDPEPAPAPASAAAEGPVPAATPISAATARAPGGAPAVEFEAVSFAYGTGPPVLEDLSFRVEPGERVALVGHTGAGKTTLVSLLCRFHETPRGVIRVGGTDICRMSHRELRARIAIVQQDVFLFSDSVAANIRMGDTSLSDEYLRKMARAVHADGFVQRLPEGYDTVLAERGANLSSGQRQLLAFARALAADPDILVLDEATSSVDSETEALIEDATRTLMSGRTCLLIAHRLSTVVNADRILVLHKGRLQEEGTHAELMAAKGLYYRLYRLHLSASV